MLTNLAISWGPHIVEIVEQSHSRGAFTRSGWMKQPRQGTPREKRSERQGRLSHGSVSKPCTPGEPQNSW